MLRARCLAPFALAVLTTSAPTARGTTDDFERDAALFLGPVAGLTDAWRVAPDETAVPLGTTVHLEQILSPRVAWSGAREVAASEHRSRAEVRLVAPGRHEVRASFAAPDGSTLTNVCVFHVVDVEPSRIRWAPIHVSAEPFHAGGELSNDETQTILERAPSIAAVTEPGPGRYRTSTWRKLRVRTATEPAGFEPLVDWSLDGRVLAHGADATLIVPFAGEQVLTAGTGRGAPSVLLETYDVTIESSLKPGEAFPEGEPVTFRAVTDPPGYEDEVVWMPSTRHGTVLPAVGQGATFTAVFQGVDGPAGDRATGVVADHARFEHAYAPAPTAAGMQAGLGIGALQLPLSAIQFRQAFVGDMQPIVGGPGTSVMFEGGGFAADPVDLTVAAEVGEGKGFPFRVLANSGNCVFTEVVAATSQSDTPVAPTVRNVSGVVQPVSFGPIDFGDVKSSCAPQDPTKEAKAPTPFTVTGTVTLGLGASAYAFTYDDVSGDLSMNVPDLTAGQSALLVLGLCWPGGWDQVLLPEVGVFGIPTDLAASAAAITLTFGLDAAFTAAGIGCTVSFDGFDEITVSCPEVDEEGFLYGYFIVFD